MSTLKEFSVNNCKFTFYCSSRSTRHGFAHDAELFCEGNKISSASCHYLNRTWECYTYQSVMKKAVGNEIDSIRSALKYEYLFVNGYERMTEKRKADFEGVFLNDNSNYRVGYLNNLYALYKML